MGYNKYHQKVTESDEQIAIFQWAEYMKNTYPELGLMFHVPNGGQRYKATAIRLKKEGVKSGVPDIVLPAPRAGYHGLFIELKVKGNKTSDNQDTWINNLNEQGYKVAVCYGSSEAIKIITEYLSENAPN